MIKQKYVKLGKQVLVEFHNRSKSNVESYSDDDLIDQILKELGYKVKWVNSGIARTAFLLDEVVIKIPGGRVYDSDRTKDMIEETQFIRKMRRHKKYGRHFPETTVVRHAGFVLQVQEKIPHVEGKLCFKYKDEVYELGMKLGIDDIHEGNYGWKGPRGKEYPVFIDVDFRYERSPKRGRKRKRRSWMVA